MVIEVQRFGLDGWLAALAQGWQLPDGWYACQSHDGAYTVRMWRYIDGVA
jgi:hypothetical protein